MLRLVVAVGFATVFVATLTALHKERLNTVVMLSFLGLIALTLVGLLTENKGVVKATHYLFITGVYFGAALCTGYAMGFFAALATVALATRLYYGTCIYHKAYNVNYKESDSGDRNPSTDVVYVAPLLIIAGRCVLELVRGGCLSAQEVH